MTNKHNTLAIVTRISKIEIPYLLSFIDFYLEKHEPDKIYFLIKVPEEIEEIKQYIESNRRVALEKIEFKIIPEENSIWLKDNVDFIKKEVKEDFIFFPDADEFLIFNNKTRLKDYIQDCPDQVLFGWYFAINDKKNNLGTNNIFKNIIPMDNHKCLVRKEIIYSLVDHRCVPIYLKDKMEAKGMGYVEYMRREENKDPFERNAYIIHYWSRSFEDTLMKMIYQQFKAEHFFRVNKKYSSAQSVKENILHNELPYRLKILAFMANMKKPIKINKIFIKIDREYEQKLLDSFINKNDLNAIYNAYIEYKNEITKLKSIDVDDISDIHNRLPSDEILYDKQIPNIYKSSKIFCIGAHRTGTKSLYMALKELGLKPAHWEEYHRAILAFIKNNMRLGDMDMKLGDELTDLFEKS